MKRLNESGRTLVEMLGVLAIIGILSVVGLVGYRLATNKMWANTLIHEAQKRAVVVAGQIGFGQLVDLANFTENTFNGTTYDTKIYTPSGALWTNVNPQFALKLSDVQTDVCAEMKKISTRTQVIQSITDDCELIVYNNDLSEAKCEENAVNGNCQKCMMGVWTNICTTEQRCVNNVCVDAPEGYTQVEYLESTGAQYIPTDLYLDGDGYKLEFKYDKETINATSAFGYQGSGDNGQQLLIVGHKAGSGDTKGETLFWCGQLETGGINRLKQNLIPFGLVEGFIEAKNNTLTYNFNNTVTGSYEVVSTFNPKADAPFWIFGNPRLSATAAHQEPTMKFYYLRVYQNNEIKANFISVLDKDGVPCVYDKASKQCFYNAGTGDFIAGPEIAPLKD